MKTKPIEFSQFEEYQIHTTIAMQRRTHIVAISRPSRGEITYEVHDLDAGTVAKMGTLQSAIAEYNRINGH